MTAAEYVKKRKWLVSVTGWLVLFGLVTGTVAGSLIHLWENGFVVRILLNGLSGLVGGIILGGGTAAASWRAIKRFDRQHPEMADLDEWRRLVGWVESYPVDNVERISMTPMAQMTLERYARAANAAIEARNNVKQLLERYRADADSSGVSVLTEAYERLSAMASGCVVAFNDRFHFLVFKMKLAPDLDPKDGRKFRESFIRRPDLEPRG